MKNLYRALLLVLFVVVGGGALAQGITTATITGSVTSSTGEPLVGATVRATHEPSGSPYGASVNAAGRFTIPNVRVGGPYLIVVEYVGYRRYEERIPTLQLGQVFPITIRMTEESVNLAEVVITSNVDPLLNSKRMGSATNISREQIQALPSLSRSIADFTRTNPLANQGGNGTSFAGSNNRFNNILIDGAVNSDIFGLTQTGTPAGTQDSRRGVEPISLDAIDQIQVVISPFDVAQGNFTGGGVNAITRSGTNDISASVYAFGRNEKLLGDLINNDRSIPSRRPDRFHDYQAGFRVGGPIIKNKLFFFFNAEVTRNRRDLQFNLGDPQRTAAQNEIISNLVTRAEAVLVNQFAREQGIGLAPIQNFSNSDKFFVRLDWNINENHNITARFNYLRADDQTFNNARAARSYAFSDAGIRTPVINTSSVLEVRSRFGSKISNQFTFNFQTVEDDRDPSGTLFPRVSIRTTINTANAANFGYTGPGLVAGDPALGDYTVTLGSEGPSQANRLSQRFFTITNNLKYYEGRHTITLGTHNEFYNFENLFLNGYAGNYTYNNGLVANEGITGWENNTTIRPTNFNTSVSRLADNPQPLAKFTAIQLGFYLQDEWEINDRIKVTAGVRIDIPYITDTPLENPGFNAFAADRRVVTGMPEYETVTNRRPKSTILWSPRVGFNWDVTGDRTTQIRGGAGVFTGRLPFVWMSNQFGNTGMDIANVALTSPATPFFLADPNNQASLVTVPGLFAANTNINVIAEDFKFPQIFRATLGIDQKIWWDMVFGFEMNFSQNINAPLYKDLNLGRAPRNIDTPVLGGSGDTRPVYNATGGTARVQWTDGFPFAAPYQANAFGHIIHLGNTNQGYTYQMTFSLTKRFDRGLDFFAAYTYGQSRSLTDNLSSIAVSSWQQTPNVRGYNDVDVANSHFNLPHRVVASISYRKEYAKYFATTVSLFYSGQSGQGISYVYRDDMNRDHRTNTQSADLIYIPRNSSEIVFTPFGSTTPAQQWEQFNAFIESNEYLRSRRGQYAERNGDRTPWTNRLDLRVRQEFLINVGGKRHTLEFTWDCFNFLAFLNPDWGWQYNIGFPGTASVLRTSSYDTSGGRLVPRFNFVPTDVFDNRPFTISSTGSTYEMQFGVRYSF